VPRAAASTILARLASRTSLRTRAARRDNSRSSALVNTIRNGLIIDMIMN